MKKRMFTTKVSDIADLLQQHSVAAYPPEIPEVRTRIFDELACD
jgi:hypothetical protein